MEKLPLWKRQSQNVHIPKPLNRFLQRADGAQDWFCPPLSLELAQVAMSPQMVPLAQRASLLVSRLRVRVGWGGVGWAYTLPTGLLLSCTSLPQTHMGSFSREAVSA